MGKGERKKMIATFNRFELEMPEAAVDDCSHSGPCDSDVEYWQSRIDRPANITPEALRVELKEYGAWDDEKLDDDAANWRRLIWIAAGDLKDEMREKATI